MTLFEHKYHIVSTTLLVFVDASEDSVMVDDVIMPSNPPIAPVGFFFFKKHHLTRMFPNGRATKNLFWRVVRIRVDHSAWDLWSSLNPHTLTIYLEFVLARKVMLKRFEKCQCENNNVCFHYWTWVPGDDHYHWLWNPINSFPMECQANYLAHTIHCLLDFLQLWFIFPNSFIEL